MYFSDLEDGLHLLPRITTDHVNLTSYSVMRVNLAAQVLSSTMASVLKKFGPPEAGGTAKFCEMMDKFFDCFNVRSLSESTKTRKAFLLPYENANDERFSWLTDEFLHYLFEWQEVSRPSPRVTMIQIDIVCYIISCDSLHVRSRLGGLARFTCKLKLFC